MLGYNIKISGCPMSI